MPPRAKKPASHDRSNPPNTVASSINSNSLGLAAPGKRILKPKSSNSTLSVAANGHPHSPNALCPSDPPRRLLNQNTSTLPEPVNGTAADAAKMGAGQSHPNGRVRTASGPSDEDLEARGVCASQAYGHVTPLRIDVNATNSKFRQQKSKLAAATTILTSCPIWDVVAILIILLQLPPTIVSVVHFLFAAMTFVPASSSTSLSNLPTIHDMLVGSAGSPSIQTIIMMDVIMLLLFIPLWTPAQNIALDLAQAVIAISLGGAAASKGGTTSSVLCCMTVIGLSHAMRWKSAPQIGLNIIWSGVMRLGSQAESPSHTLSGFSNKLYASNSWPRCLLGVHILAQGVLRMVRRYLLWRVALTETPIKVQKVDPEAGTGSATNTPRTQTSMSDSMADFASGVSTDGRLPGPSSASKDRPTNGRKKKKQVTHVRMQQPFWAALASTKVTVAKECEPAQGQLDAAEAGAADLSNMGNVEFNNLPNRVWISSITATDISFGVCLPSDDDNEKDEGVTFNNMDSRGWHVRVNGASWISVKSKLVENREVGHELVDVWEGRIYGLTPLSSYHCEFVREEDLMVIYDTSVITQPAPSTETAATIPSPIQTLQPSSPTTTLRNSIGAAEQESEKSKNNLKSVRKQHKTAIERLQSQIDRERSKLTNNGGSEDRQRQRAKQLENSIIKIKADHDEAEQTLAELGEIPKEEKGLYRKAKEEARMRRKAMDGRRLSYEKAKKETDKDVTSVKTEIESILHKRSRFEARQKEYATKLAETERKKDKAIKAKSGREKDRSELAERRRHQQSHLESVIMELERQLGEETKKQTASAQAIQECEDWARGVQNGSAPGTPEVKPLLPFFSGPLGSAGLTTSALGSASLPGSRPSSLHVSGFTPGFQFPAPIGPPSGLSNRRRASSLESEEFPTLYHYPYSGTNTLPGYASFTPASSAGMLPTSTPFVPLSNGHTSSGLSNGFSYNSNSATASAGADKGARRKHSGGSNRSGGGGSGSVNGSPRFGKASTADMNGSGRGGLVSPPGSAVWKKE